MSGCPYSSCSSTHCCVTWDWAPYEPPKPDWLVKAEERLARRLASEEDLQDFLDRVKDPGSLWFWQRGHYLGSEMYTDSSSN